MENEKPKKISDYLKMMCCITATGEVVDKAMDTASNTRLKKERVLNNKK